MELEKLPLSCFTQHKWHSRGQFSINNLSQLSLNTSLFVNLHSYCKTRDSKFSLYILRDILQRLSPGFSKVVLILIEIFLILDHRTAILIISKSAHKIGN